MKELESSKDMLIRELQDCPYVKDGFLGHAGSYNKLVKYIRACIKGNILRTECWEWLEDNIAKQLTNQEEIEKIKNLIEGAYLCKEIL